MTTGDFYFCKATGPYTPDATWSTEMYPSTYYWPLLKMAPIVITLRDIKRHQVHLWS